MLSLVELERAVRIASERFGGSSDWQIQDVVQPDAERLVLTLYGREADGQPRRRHLLLCCSEQAGRLSLLERPPRKPATPLRFAQWLKAHVVGARVSDLRVLGRDRIVGIDLTGREECSQLVLQLLGRRSNVYALDAAGRVATSLRSLAATRPELSLGEPWRPPQSGPPSLGDDRFAAADDAGFVAALEAHYSGREAADAVDALRRRIDRSLQKEERRVERKLEKLGAELAAAGEAEELARHGELLKGALGRVGRRASEVVVPDPETGRDVVIPLDPAKSPAENLELLFKRYKKALRKLTKGGAQQDVIRRAASELERMRSGFEAALASESLEAFAQVEEIATLLARHAPAPQTPGQKPASKHSNEVQLGKRSVPRRLAPRRYPTENGLEIWVGRSDAANDFLTTRLARGKDLFFHLDGAPGSHVILRTEGRDDPPSEAVIDACELAVHYSKAKNATRADVHVVPIRNVKKPKGAKPGLVHVHGGRTIHLRRIPSRLERLLASRIQD
jgi:predicted ribosome quality control (RQC) complex YloA/Tae2 family protein